jgi:DNA repair exonuclease SbcCD ATPase subunit
VGLKAFALDSADVADGDGGARPEEFLSAGTRDAFLLAARLTLARKSVAAGGRALVVLDEPFIALDRARTARALDVLKEFHETAGWQIVIFTKDEVLEKQAEKVFGGLLTVTRL